MSELVDSPDQAAVSANQPSRKKLWMAAIKPPMYSVAVMPIWVGTAIAHFQTQQVNWQIFATFLLSAIVAGHP